MHQQFLSNNTLALKLLSAYGLLTNSSHDKHPPSTGAQSLAVDTSLNSTLEIYWQLLKNIYCPTSSPSGHPVCNLPTRLLDHLSKPRAFLLSLFFLSSSPPFTFCRGGVCALYCMCICVCVCGRNGKHLHSSRRGNMLCETMRRRGWMNGRMARLKEWKCVICFICKTIHTKRVCWQSFRNKWPDVIEETDKNRDRTPRWGGSSWAWNTEMNWIKCKGQKG